VLLSIVGVDRVDTGYYAGKRAQEELVLAGDVPATVLRATQFHEFAEQVLALAAGRWRPSRACGSSRSRAARSARTSPSWPGRAAGPGARARRPEVHELTDLVRRLLRAAAPAAWCCRSRGPTAASRAAVGGALLPTGRVRGAADLRRVAAGVGQG
jgi:hypothetical protein